MHTPPPAAHRDRAARLLDALWRALRRPWLFAVALALLAALLLLEWLIPQIPGQMADDPAAAVRWLNLESDRWGRAGGVMEVLGLFDVGAGPLFFALLSLLALLALLHLAEALRVARLGTRVPHLFTSAPPEAPITVAWPFPLFRRRIARPSPLEHEAAALADLLRRHRLDVTQAAIDPEQRLLGSQRLWVFWLRACLPLGALFVVSSLWVNSIWGWSIDSPELAPGDSFAVEARDLVIRYPALMPGATLEGALFFEQGDVETPLSIDQGTAVGAWSRARVASRSPALLLAAPDAVLARPDDLEPRAAVGLLFPQVGSEQVVVLPEAGAGLRAVRLSADSGSRFLLELFAPDEVEPVERVEVTGVDSITLPAGEPPLELQIIPAQGVVVTAAHRPAEGGIWLGVLLVVLGAAGWLLRSGFALVQMRPWPQERTEVILQTTDATLAAALDETS